jgi:hypothetical protein
LFCFWLIKKIAVLFLDLSCFFVGFSPQFSLLFLCSQSTQISDADPGTCQRAHTFLIKTVSLHGVSEHTLSADSTEEVSKWWDGFQQHLLDQGTLSTLFFFSGWLTFREFSNLRDFLSN